MTAVRQRTDEAAEPSVLEALDALRVAITVFDAGERLIYANRHFRHLFRSLPQTDELIGKRYDELIRGEIARNDVADADGEAFVARRRAQLVSGDPHDVVLADGRIVEIKVRATKGGGRIALWTDVTQARHNLDRLQNAIALSADAFAFYDRRDRLVLCNEEYALINGAASAAELIGCGFAEVAERTRLAVAGDGADWVKRRQQVHRLPAGTMTVEFAHGDAYLLRDRATSDGGRAVVFTDVTEHHRVEKALAEQTRALQATRHALARSEAETTRQADYLADLTIKLDQIAAQADSTKRTFLRTMSHELKTPLNAIIGFSDLLQSLADHAGPDQVREYAGLIHQGGKNLLRLINQILDLTKIAAGRYELHRQAMDAATGLWTAKDACQEQALAKNIRILTDGCTPGLMIEADENAFGAMVGQLLENAVHFTQAGGVVQLLAERAGSRVRITVKDDGPGVAAEDLDRILKPFEQGGRTAADHAGGAGLGLTLVKALAELHGGTLHLSSALGEGFAASIELPEAAA